MPMWEFCCCFIFYQHGFTRTRYAGIVTNRLPLFVECTANDWVFVDEDIAEWLYEEYGDLECLRFIEKEGENFKPFYVFYFALGKIVKRVNI